MTPDREADYVAIKNTGDICLCGTKLQLEIEPDRIKLICPKCWQVAFLNPKEDVGAYLRRVIGAPSNLPEFEKEKIRKWYNIYD